MLFINSTLRYLIVIIVKVVFKLLFQVYNDPAILL
ncbi:MAG: hypothetical protein ACI9KN_001107, partial [Gammaproteobacteria bacterium]